VIRYSMTFDLKILTGLVEGIALNLAGFSVPARLTIAVTATAIVVLVLAWALSRRRRTQNDQPDSPQTSLTPLQGKDRNSRANTGLSNGHNTTDLNKDADPLNLPFDKFKTNLDDIVKASELMMRTSANGHVAKCSLQIKNQAESMLCLLQNSQAISATHTVYEPIKPMTVDFETFIYEQNKKWSGIFKSTDIKFTIHRAPNIPPTLFFDPALFKRIINSVLGNSQSLTKSGRIHLHLTGEQLEDYDWRLTAIIADTGAGYSADIAQAILAGVPASADASPEYINLAGSRSLIQKMGGTFDMKTVEGRGTETIITFPVRAAMVMAQEAKDDIINTEIKSLGSLAGRHVLIIEDDKASQEVLATFLKPEGCEIDCIDDGDFAMTALARKSYDLVLMDVRMDGLDGIKTTQLIRKSQTSFKNIPIIAITADTSPDTNAKCMMAGVDLFLNKPVSAKGLFDAIKFVMDVSSDMRTAATG